MKKATMKSLVAYLNGEAISNLDEIKAELEAELNKDAEKATATKNEYEAIHNAVIKVLRSTTQAVTAQELADETGLAKGKIVYGLSHYWQDEVIKVEGKVNSYLIKE